MAYFRELPNVQYPSPITERTSDRDYVTIKNIFRRVKLRDDLEANLSAFERYEVRSGQRPDTLAAEYYGNPDLDWLILIVNNITNVRDQWPLSDQQLYEFALNKHGDMLNHIAHYITTEVRDDAGRLIYPAGVVVDYNFTITDPDNPNATLNPVTGMTNYECEVGKNNQKRSITLLRTEYVQQAVNNLKEELTYTRSSQYVDSKTIKADNIRLKS